MDITSERMVTERRLQFVAPVAITVYSVSAFAIALAITDSVPELLLYCLAIWLTVGLVKVSEIAP